MGSTNSPPNGLAGTTWTFSTLPATAPVGTILYTSDAGMCRKGADGYWGQVAAPQIAKHPFVPAGIANVQAVMTTPPTVAISTTNPLAAGYQVSPFLNSQQIGGGVGSIDLSFCSVFRARNPLPAGLTSPDYNCVKWDHVSATAGGLTPAGGNSVGIGVMFTGLQIVMVVKGLSTNITAKVNDQYVSIAPTAVPANATLNFYSLTFATAVPRRIDFIGDNVLGAFKFGGFWISTGDVLYAAPARGRTLMVVGDSFTTATGAGSTALGFPGVLGEFLGYDDVIQSGIGGTGLINPGSYCTYATRAATDIYAYAPDEILITGFFNDNSSTSGQIQAALTSFIAGIVANLPSTLVTIVAPYINSGSGYHGADPGFTGQRSACSAAIASFNSPLIKYIDPTTGPTPPQPQILTTTAPITAGATTFLTTSIGFVTPGSTYQWPDGTRSIVLSRSGYTATVDRVATAWPSGTQITQVGGCYLRGNGKVGAVTGVGNADTLVFSDGIHPAAAGHLQLGILIGSRYAANLNN